jgi:hypothetical protein
MCVLIFYTAFVWNIYHSEEKGVRFGKKCRLVSMEGTNFPCQILVKLELSWQFFEKKTKISLKSVQWESSIFMWMDRWTDRHDEANSRFSQFCEGA